MGEINFTIAENWQLIHESHIEQINGERIPPIYIPIIFQTPYFKVFVQPPTDPRAINWFKGGWFKLYSGNASQFGGSQNSAAISFYSVLLGEWRILNFPLVNSNQFFIEYQCPFWFPSSDFYIYQYQPIDDNLIP